MSKSNRFYRNLVNETSLTCFQVLVAETDLLIYANQDLTKKAYQRVVSYRNQIESFICQFPAFATTLSPWTTIESTPDIVRQMIHAGKCAGVGPMASVAGVIAEMVGEDLRQYSDEIIVENGGDLFLCKHQPLNVGIYAGESPFSQRIGIRLDGAGCPFSICTSSGVIGHSLSFGKADAVIIRSRSAAIADAVATATGNRVKSREDIADAVQFAKNIDGVDGVLILVGEAMGAWGNLEIIAMNV